MTIVGMAMTIVGNLQCMICNLQHLITSRLGHGKARQSFGQNCSKSAFFSLVSDLSTWTRQGKAKLWSELFQIGVLLG
jgi:hypothetical protein